MALCGARVARFREGWLLPMFTRGKAHYFLRMTAGNAVALCGYTYPSDLLLEPGTFPLCKRCEAKTRPTTQGGSDE